VTFPEGFTSRSAQPPYDKIPIPRKDIPAGIIISRFADEWIREQDVEDISVPLYQGIMINNLNSNASSYTLTEKNNYKWVKNEVSNNTLSPKYLISIKEENCNAKWKKGIKIAFRGIARNTDQRTFIGSVLDFYSSGHSISLLIPNSKSVQNIFNLSILTSSYFFDYQIRMRMAGTNLSEFILSECFLPINYRYKSYRNIVLSIIDDGKYSRIGIEYSLKDRYRKRAITPNSKISFQVIAQVTAAYLFKLDTDDVRHILQETDYSLEYIKINKNELWSTGFWRVDKDKDPELRQTVLTIVAFHDLQKHIEACGGDREKGLDSFLNQNNGEGWMIPETLRLADYGLGHDDRALEHQPVASRLGPRYYDWQLAQTPEESWAECHVHARNLLGKEAYDRLIHRIEKGLPLEDEEESSPAAEPDSAPPKKRGRKPKSNNPPPPTLF
jgi:hypothetical protein